MRSIFFAALAAMLAVGCNTQSINTYNTAPQAQITLPAPEAEIETLPISFAGSVRDDQDAPEELTVRWYDNLAPETALNEGNPDTAGYTQFSVAALTTGTHIITLEVTDTKGATDQDTIQITVLTDPPLVEITQPLSGGTYYEGELIDFAGNVSNADETEFDLHVQWASDVQGELFVSDADGDGNTNFAYSLDAGYHIVSLYATDSFGVQGSDSVTIEVSEFPVGQLDQDGDGFCPDGIDVDGDGECDDSEVTGPNSQDCNDFNEDVCPICPEICDGISDNNCDGEEDASDADADSDGYSICQGDCDDENPFVNPGEDEVCDGLDTNCDSYTPPDEVDVDGDDYFLCDDCDDNNDAVNPGVSEICDGFDNDCDGIDDNGFDLDGDGWATCEGDCNDANNSIHPDMWDDCSDNLDNDCDGLINDDMAGDFEMWETSSTSSGYSLDIAAPGLFPGSGSCQFDAGFFGTMHLEPGSGAASGNFSSQSDLYDIFSFDTNLSSNTAAWAIILLGGVPSGCGEGEISWSSSVAVQVSMYIEGDLVATGIGTNETVDFALNLTQLFDVDYDIVVQPTASWVPDPSGTCGPSYTLNFEIP
ncbi:MAG: hypothetical protein GY898_14825 [Proteobacteria bacterium]|nr:hypothetical protein [Pseudomonadota bacterium]